MGFVIVAADTLGGYDLLPDWVGWGLVLWGVAALPVPERPTLLTAGALAAAVSVLLWFPQVHEPLREAELSLRWAASLPDLLFVFLLSRALVQAAQATDPPDRKFAGRFGVALWATVLVAVLPVLGNAADSADLIAGADVGFVLLWLWLIWNLFAAHNRPYAGGEVATERRTDS